MPGEAHVCCRPSRALAAAAARRDRRPVIWPMSSRSYRSLARQVATTGEQGQRIAGLAASLVRAARASRHEHGGIDAFMHEYGLTSDEGIILMCLAEALLRIPDADTADALIAEKIGERTLGEAPRRLRQPVRQCLHLRA